MLLLFPIKEMILEALTLKKMIIPISMGEIDGEGPCKRWYNHITMVIVTESLAVPTLQILSS